MSPLAYLRTYLSRTSAIFTTKDDLVTGPVAITGDPPKSRFRLDNDSSHTFTLPDGRNFGYAQYGSQTGRPIVYLHGLPGSRIEAAAFDDLGQELGARIISVDRPGIGWSSPHFGRKILDHAKDIDDLATHLELDDYGVLGISGGGPYALACAISLPREKLKCVSIVCGLGPPDIGMRGARFMNWLGFTVGWRIAPLGLVRWYFSRQPEGRLDLTDEKRLELLQQCVSKSEATAHEKDLDVMKDEDILRLLLRSTRESFAQGFDGVRQDGKLMSLDHGFRIEDIRHDLPVRLWYGKLDVYVPLRHGEQIAARLGGRAHLRVEDETHASISAKRKKEILEDLLGSM